MNIDITTLGIKQAHDLLVNKEITVHDLVHLYLDNAQKQNSEINQKIKRVRMEKGARHLSPY